MYVFTDNDGDISLLLWSIGSIVTYHSLCWSLEMPSKSLPPIAKMLIPDYKFFLECLFVDGECKYMCRQHNILLDLPYYI